MSNPDDPWSWLSKAQADFQCIENNIAGKTIPWDTVAFHAQQAAEKMLKALLVSKRIRVPRTHDLGRVLGECLAAGIAVGHLADDCDYLTPFAVGIRYPGDEPDVSEVEAREAVAAAERIAEAVKTN